MASRVWAACRSCKPLLTGAPIALCTVGSVGCAAAAPAASTPVASPSEMAADSGAPAPEVVVRPAADSASSCAPSSSIPGACNDLTDVGSPVTATCAAGVVPTGTGGAIADGTYALTSIVAYGCSDAGAAPPQSQTVVISRGCGQGVAHAGGEVLSTTQSMSVSGNELRGSLICPPLPAQPQTMTFTATPASLTLFHPAPMNQVYVYTRKVTP